MARLTRPERRAQTVLDLAAAAEIEFGTHGYHAVTIDAVAQRAGYTRGAVYGNFPTGKPDLFLFVAEARTARYVDRINAALASGDGGTIADVYLDVRRRARATPGWGRALVEFGLVAADDDSLRERFAALRRATVERVRSGLEALGPRATFDAREMATVVVALEVGLDLLRTLDGDLVTDDLEFRVVERLGGWDQPPSA
ncbi:MAG TPA: TetR/AcrR family transcriptional regulator [Ilumatobacteraceae bacterium]|nr:TetR/AcrR family transcriptional regulator [Ilumatobacteraceae bacterium]